MRTSREEGKPGGLEAQPAPPHCGRGPLCQPSPTPHLPSAWSLGSWFPNGCVCSRETPICWQSEGRVWGCQARHPTASSMASPHSPAPDSSPLPCRSPPVPASLEGTLLPPPLHPPPHIPAEDRGTCGLAQPENGAWYTWPPSWLCPPPPPVFVLQGPAGKAIPTAHRPCLFQPGGPLPLCPHSYEAAFQTQVSDEPRSLGFGQPGHPRITAFPLPILLGSQPGHPAPSLHPSDLAAGCNAIPPPAEQSKTCQPGPPGPIK